MKNEYENDNYLNFCQLCEKISKLTDEQCDEVIFRIHSELNQQSD